MIVRAGNGINIGKVTLSRGGIACMAGVCTMLYIGFLFMTLPFCLLSFMAFDGGASFVAYAFVGVVMLVPFSLAMSLAGMWIAFGFRHHGLAVLFCILPVVVTLFSMVTISALSLAGY
jgi:hypothetical protein